MNDPSLPGDASGISSNGDGKDPAAFRTIGEVASVLGIRQHVLRYWEEQFPTLRPLTRAGGRRYYRPEDVALIGEIDRLLNREGYTIKGARQALRGTRPGPAPALAAGGESRDIRLAVQIQAIRDRLANALGDQPG